MSEYIYPVRSRDAPDVAPLSFSASLNVRFATKASSELC